MSICAWQAKRRIPEIAKICSIMPIKLRLIFSLSTAVWRNKRMISSKGRLQDKDDQESQSVDQSYKYPSSRENIAFDDDVWDLSFRSNVATRSVTRVSFTNCPDIVKYQVKQYVRDGI